MDEGKTTPDPARRLRRVLRARFSLRRDMADPEAIDQGLRAGVEIGGSNAWILMFAILIASIGLNVNSTAVIIGAMLISPLMGPIMGVGYGVGINDFPLIRRSLQNLGIAAALSVVTSTAYFLISPLAEAQSELLARTTPTLWDVLIALFGGLAGVVGVTRREKSNVLPGVAIATALMPPLCTAGYGIAKGNLAFFAGALYLFAINSVFIAFSTVTVIELLRLPNRQFVDAATEKRVSRALWALVVVVALPSLYLANRLVREELFRSRAREFARREFTFPTTHVTDLQIVAAERKIDLTLLGDPLAPDAIAAIEQRLPDAGLADARLRVHQARTVVDAAAIRQAIMGDLIRDGLTTAGVKDREIDRLREEVARLAARRAQLREILIELKAQYPTLQDVVVGEGVERVGEGDGEREVLVVSARTNIALRETELERLRVWLEIRGKAPVSLRIETSKAAPGTKRRAS